MHYYYDDGDDDEDEGDDCYFDGDVFGEVAADDFYSTGGIELVCTSKFTL